MNLRSTAASADSSRKLLVAFGFVVIFAVAAYEFAEMVLAGDMMGFAYVVLLTVASVFIIAILNNWRNGVYFFFTWLLFEDLARKYLGNNMAVYFAKDVLVAVVYLSFFIAVRRKKTARIVRPPFFVAVMRRGVEDLHDSEPHQNQREVIRIFRTVQRAALAISLAMVALFFAFPDALLARLAIYSETLTPGSSASELQTRTWDYPLRNFLGAFNYDRWPYGYGIGTSSLGVQYVARIFHGAPMGIGVESGFGTLIVEMGIGGLVLWLIMSIAILVPAWKLVKKLRGSPWFPIAFAIYLYAFVLLLPMTFTSMVAYEDFVINAYFWTLLGILFRLPTLPLSSQFANVPAPAAGTRVRAR